MKIQFLEECELEIVHDFDEESEIADCDDMIFKVGDVYDVDIIDEVESGEEKFANIQFADGSMVYNVNQRWYKELI